ncbi:MAG: type II secretion system protein GspD [Phycisphaeraceae bacterium]|nr:type II secretion system protein GspD [Phycisphaeraceae bacterium]
MLETLSSMESKDGLASSMVEHQQDKNTETTRQPKDPAENMPPAASEAKDKDAHQPETTDKQPVGTPLALSQEGLLVGAESSVKARIAADVHTNSIIVIAPPSVQRVYEALIRQLDQRRPQVLLEATVVTLDTSDNFSLGVEIAGRGASGDMKIITFSSFGLSTIAPTTGVVTPTASTGLNTALLNAGDVELILKAMKRTGRSDVRSSPKLLVDDNQTGKIAATSEEPYQSVNASDTVATTSFGGFVEAGTTIKLTPHISSGNYVQLEYAIELSSFTGDRVQNLPPPRQKNQVESTVAVPNGLTIVVGGLKRKDFNDTVTRIPILGEIPILEYLFRNQVKSEGDSTMFVFIRATILDDGEFRDLARLSADDLERAAEPGNDPVSEPLMME